VVKASDIGKVTLKMAFKAKVSIIFCQKLILDRTVRVVTGLAALAKSLVLVNKRAPFFLMTVEAEVTGFHKTGRLDSGFVDGVARGAAHSSFGNLVMIRKIEGGLHIKMALVTCLSLGADDIFPQIRRFFTRLIHVDATRTVAHLANFVFLYFSFRNEPAVLSPVKLRRNSIMAGFAGFSTHKAGPRHER